MSAPRAPRSPQRAGVLAALALLGVTTAASSARAQEAAPTARGGGPTVGRWLYVDDGVAPAPLQAVGISRFTYTGGTTGALRPFASNVARPGALVEAGGEVGVTPWLSLSIVGTNDGRPAAEVAASGFVAGLRVTPLGRGATGLSLSGGVLRELGGSAGVWARASVSRELGRLQLAATVHGEHVVAQGRDGLDVMVMAGASYRMTGVLRAGVEYVAQDLEGAGMDGGDAEQGMRHFVGPTVALALHPGLTLSGGPAFGLSHGSPSSLGRIALACAF